jgi:hypothetical protein
MSNFDFGLQDFSDEDFFAQAAGLNQKNRDRSGEPQTLSTTASKSQIPRKGLTVTSTSSILQGSGLFRPNSFIASVTNQSLSSDLSGLMLSEGGVTNIMGGRQGLLAKDIGKHEGFSDGRMNGLSGMLMGEGESSPVGGQTPHAAPPNAVQGPPGPRTAGVEAVMSWAESVVGTPYSQCIGRSQDPPCTAGNKAPTNANPSTGGRFGPDHYDCSGFVTSAFLFGMGLEINPQAGNYNTTYTMLAQPALMATEVPANQIQRGDIALASPHVAIVWGDGKIIDAGSPGVTIRNNWMPGYYRDTRYFRIINLPW